MLLVDGMGGMRAWVRESGWGGAYLYPLSFGPCFLMSDIHDNSGGGDDSRAEIEERRSCLGRGRVRGRRGWGGCDLV